MSITSPPVRVQWFAWWLLCLAALSAGLLLWHDRGMNRTLIVDSATHYQLESFDDRFDGGHSTGNLTRTSDGLVERCTMHLFPNGPYCGVSVVFGAATGGIDLSRFDSVTLDIRTSPPQAVPIQIDLLNFDPAYAHVGQHDSLKANQMQYLPGREGHSLTVPLKIFQVAPWWVTERKIAPRDAMPDLRNITELDVEMGDAIAPGTYAIDVRSIAFHGKWISKVQLLWIILALWLASAAVYVLRAFQQSRKALHALSRQKRELESVNRALELKRQELELVARHDELAGMLNRTGLRDHLYEGVRHAHSGAAPMSVIFMDIDHFKQVNDRYGHPVGDDVLRQLAQFLLAHTRGDDFVCRWGGEEFVILSVGTTVQSAYALAEKLRVLISGQRWVGELTLSCSFGVAEMAPAEDVGHFFKRVDEALYRAKQGGRNQVNVDQPDGDDAMDAPHQQRRA